MAKIKSIQDQAESKLGYLIRTIQASNTAIREVNQKAEHAGISEVQQEGFRPGRESWNTS
jgi:hypothetical protein